VTGQWEDFVSRELVAWVDEHYRTLARSDSRGIAGHSMGGYGAIMLAMKHPH
jgi:S-formylglutathione hydrolase FrmB